MRTSIWFKWLRMVLVSMIGASGTGCYFTPPLDEDQDPLPVVFKDQKPPDPSVNRMTPELYQKFREVAPDIVPAPPDDVVESHKKEKAKKQERESEKG